MFSLLIWCVYGIFVGSIAKAVVPGEERMGFFQTVALGVIGSYVGGAALYALGSYDTIQPTGIVYGIGGAAVSLIVYNKLNKT
jgi:uncharacterized membrane protein YeaQ/YmgE (transglycosylase-associated protein family)